MNPDRWQQIETLFQSALERAPIERAAFLQQSCDDDQSLRGEVERLLNSFDAADQFMERPAVAAVLPLPTAPQAGDVIGHYRIESLLGCGGMGEVYLAHDDELERPVALKFLSAPLTADPDRIARFHREARAASALNHPNIITVYEIGEQQGVHFIATEFVAGETLRQKIAAGALPLNEALTIAQQIADALAAAHTAGIVHRDIKPENVMVRPDGLVKVLDFGLAKPVNDELPNTSLPRAMSLQTDPNSLLGTLAYLAPEQLNQQLPDHRADLFSMGVVLYEMLTGKRPFQGDDVKGVLTAMQRDIVTHKLPASVQPVLRRALAQEPTARYQTAAELRRALLALTQERPSRWRSKAMIAAALFIAALTLAGFWRLAAKSPPTWRDAQLTHLTDEASAKAFPNFAPDGQAIVYASRASGNWDIYLQPINAREAVNLTADYKGPDLQPVFSPDGQRIAFHSSRDGDGLYVMNADGSNVQRLTEGGHHPSWSPDGREIVFSTIRIWDYEGYSGPSQLYAYNLQTGTRRLITAHEAVQPNWSPQGNRIAFWGIHNGGQRDIWTVAANGDAVVAVTDDTAQDWNPVWSPDGKYLYFLSNRSGSMNLWRVALDETTGRALSEPEAATLPSASNQHFTFSADGKNLVYVQMNRRENLWQADFDPVNAKLTSTPIQITRGARRHATPELSPDGELIVARTVGEAQEDIFVINRDGTGFRQLTNYVAQNRSPSWSPDGRRIAFFSDQGGTYGIWQIGRDGQNLQRLTPPIYEACHSPLWSPDGTRLLYQTEKGMYVMNPDKPFAEQSPQRLPGLMPKGFFARSWSADGQWLAGTQEAHKEQKGGLSVYSLGTGQYEHLSEIGNNPLWLNDSRRILVHRLSELYVVDRVTKQARPIYSTKPDPLTGLMLSRDNRTLYYARRSEETDLCLLTLK